MAVGPRFDTNGICIYVECEQHKYYKLPPCISFERRCELSETPTEADELCFYIEFADNSSNFIYSFIDEVRHSAPHWIVADTSYKYSPILFSDIVDCRQYDYRCRLILKNNSFDTWMAYKFDLHELREDLKMAKELVPYDRYNTLYVADEKYDPSFELFGVPRGNNKLGKAIEKMYGSVDSKSIQAGIITADTITMGSKPFINMPVISDIYYVAPYTTVKWMDGTTTTVKAGKDDEFNKEYGLAMAIAKKYYECLEAPNPRAAFKKAAYKDAHDQTEKTAQKRAYKEEKKKRNKRGRISSSKKTSKR